MNTPLISVSEAFKIILVQPANSKPETVKLQEALGRIAADDIYAPFDHPHFDNSAVDGYGIRCEDLPNNPELKFQVAGEIKAGDNATISLKKNQTVRIFTGALVPSCVNAVVMQENVKASPGFIEIIQKDISAGTNIRKQGHQIHKGEICLPKGSLLNAAAMGFLASVGISKVKVTQLPRVAVIVTGNEITRQGRKLKPGQIFESNGVMLGAALMQLNIKPKIFYCKDDLSATKKIIAAAEKKHDLILVTGGVSVGDYDFTTAATQSSGFKALLHGIQQKPGKPLLFARKKNTFLFGLPGNPRAVLTCWYEYILPFIKSQMGAKDISLKNISLPAAHEIKKKSDGKTHFVTGKIINGKIEILKGQDSDMLRSFAGADVLVTLPAEKEFYPENEIISAHLLPQ